MLVGQSLQQDEVDLGRVNQSIIRRIDQISSDNFIFRCAAFWGCSFTRVLRLVIIFLRDTAIRPNPQVQLQVSLDLDQKLRCLLYVILVGPAARVPIVEPILLWKHIPAANVDVAIHVPIEMPGETD